MSIFFWEFIDKYCGGVCGGWDNFLVVIFGGFFIFILFKYVCDD